MMLGESALTPHPFVVKSSSQTGNMNDDAHHRRPDGYTSSKSSNGQQPLMRVTSQGSAGGEWGREARGEGKWDDDGTNSRHRDSGGVMARGQGKYSMPVCLACLFVSRGSRS